VPLLYLLCFFVSCDPEVSYIDELRGIADQVNRKCPQMLDSETRLDGIEIAEPNTIIYKYTLVNLQTMDVDTGAFRRAMWPGLVSNVKVTSEMKKLRDNQTTLRYAYYDKAKKPICTLTITPQHYK
jgi:hypothetical protein